MQTRARRGCMFGRSARWRSRTRNGAALNDRFSKIQATFVELFQNVDAVALVVLKGHLLIEEALDTILRKFVYHPEFLSDARLSFAQKIEIARSISLDEHNNEMWALVKAINSLRNELAHSLGSEKRSQKTERVVELYLKLLEDRETAARHKGEPEEHVLMWATGLCIGFLSEFVQEVDRFRSVVDTLDRAINPHRHIKKHPG